MLVPSSCLGSAEEPRWLAALTPSSAALHLSGKPGEIPLFIAAAGVPRIEPCVSRARLALLSEFPGPAGSGLSCSGGGVVGGGGRSALSFPLWKQCTITAAPAAVFAQQAMLNRISSACGHKVCAGIRLKTGCRHTHRGISAPDCICWGYSSQSRGALAPRLRMWWLSHP